jgi:hypothetical protein
MTSDESIPADRNVALFELSPQPRLVDVVSVPGFPDDPGDYKTAVNLNASTYAYVFEAFHSNSSQGYQGSTLLFVRGDRIEEILNVSLLSSRGYGEAESFEETVDISSQPDAGRTYRSILVKVTFKRLADEPDSPHRPLRKAYTRYYSAVYRWDSGRGRFVTASKELDALQVFNTKEY